jgi:hypothetical protein
VLGFGPFGKSVLVFERGFCIACVVYGQLFLGSAAAVSGGGNDSVFVKIE